MERIEFNYESKDKFVSMSLPIYMCTSDIVEEFVRFMVAVGHHPDNVRCALEPEESIQPVDGLEA